MQEVQSKGPIQPWIVVMTGGKPAGIMVDSKFICKVKMEDAVPVFMTVFYVNVKKFHALEYIFF